MSQAFSYESHTARNQGYIDPAVQDRIRRTTLLIAGCGIGSSIAVGAARMGFERFILADGDVVDSHNLNRQFYDFADIGKSKVHALESAILRINPSAAVKPVPSNLDESNIKALVGEADMVIDTVDFLDLPAILALHDEAHVQGKPVLTALSVGFGALVWCFDGTSDVTLRSMLQADIDVCGSTAEYARVFSSFFGRLRPWMDVAVVENIAHVIERMRDGAPCPASQVAAGSFGVAALSLALMRKMLAGEPAPMAPTMVFHSFDSHRAELIDMTQPG